MYILNKRARVPGSALENVSICKRVNIKIHREFDVCLIRKNQSGEFTSYIHTTKQVHVALLVKTHSDNGVERKKKRQFPVGVLFNLVLQRDNTIWHARD